MNGLVTPMNSPLILFTLLMISFIRTITSNKSRAISQTNAKVLRSRIDKYSSLPDAKNALDGSIRNLCKKRDACKKARSTLHQLNFDVMGDPIQRSKFTEDLIALRGQCNLMASLTREDDPLIRGLIYKRVGEGKYEQTVREKYSELMTRNLANTENLLGSIFMVVKTRNIILWALKQLAVEDVAIGGGSIKTRVVEKSVTIVQKRCKQLKRKLFEMEMAHNAFIKALVRMENNVENDTKTDIEDYDTEGYVEDYMRNNIEKDTEDYDTEGYVEPYMKGIVRNSTIDNLEDVD